MNHRPITIQRHVMPYAEGSALIEMGRTRVLCAASVSADLPPWLRGQGRGWVTGEYGMLPRSTQERKPRDRSRDGRSIEIQRLIGRSLRAAVDLERLGERMITVDCDVLLADGGTRTAAITGGMIALCDALLWMKRRNSFTGPAPLRHFVAAVSVGVVRGKIEMDLDYERDSAAEVDMNVVMTEHGDFIEVQGTGERGLFDRKRLDEMLNEAQRTIRDLVVVQKNVLREGSDDLAELLSAPEPRA